MQVMENKSSYIGHFTFKFKLTAADSCKVTAMI